MWQSFAQKQFDECYAHEIPESLRSCIDLQVENLPRAPVKPGQQGNVLKIIIRRLRRLNTTTTSC